MVKLRVVAFDPGETTGVVVASIKPTSKTITTINHGEIPWEKDERAHFDHFLYWTSFVKRNEENIALIEDVVKSGNMSTNKFNQILSFDRAVISAQQRGFSTVLIQPNINKNAVGRIPEDVKGDHIRDAYRLILTYLEQVEV